MTTHKFTRLKALTELALTSIGSSPATSKLVGEHLALANLMGHDSHGIGMLPAYIKHVKAGLVNVNSTAKLMAALGPLLMFDAQRSFGVVAGTDAINQGIDVCKKQGVAVVTLANAHHLGRIGRYAELAMEKNVISFHFVNVVDHRPLVAPWGGSDARLGTNPICIGIPSLGPTSPPLLLDMATSQIALGKARELMNRGMQAPKGLLLDSQGNLTEDPNVMFPKDGEEPGALVTAGLHKGSSLSIVAETLAGVFSRGGTINPAHKRHGSIINSMFSVLVDADMLINATAQEGVAGSRKSSSSSFAALNKASLVDVTARLASALGAQPANPSSSTTTTATKEAAKTEPESSDAVDATAGLGWMQAEMEQLVAYLKASPPRNVLSAHPEATSGARHARETKFSALGSTSVISLPGEYERGQFAVRMREGVFISDGAWLDILNAVKSAGVSQKQLTEVITKLNTFDQEYAQAMEAFASATVRENLAALRRVLKRSQPQNRSPFSKMFSGLDVVRLLSDSQISSYDDEAHALVQEARRDAAKRVAASAGRPLDEAEEPLSSSAAQRVLAQTKRTASKRVAQTKASIETVEALRKQFKKRAAESATTKQALKVAARVTEESSPKAAITTKKAAAPKATTTKSATATKSATTKKAAASKATKTATTKKNTK